MSQTIGSDARVRWDRRDRLSRAQFERDLTRILELIPEIRHAWDHAVEGGAYAVKGDGNGRGTGFTDLRPTESAVFSPTRRQLRRAAGRAAEEVGNVRRGLEYAADVLAHGLLATDPEVYRRDLEKRQAAEQGRR